MTELDETRSDNINQPKPLSCFVVSPIGTRGETRRKRADMLLRYIIAPVVRETMGIEPKRADDDERPGSITKQMLIDLSGSDLVIADLSGHNPNVFYEIGIQHALGRRIIHMEITKQRYPLITLSIGQLNTILKIQIATSKRATI